MRLRAIRRLQEAFFPLDAIAAELEGRPIEEIEAIADGKLTPVSGGSARESGEREREAERERQRQRERDRDEEDARSAIAREASRVFRRIELFPGVDLTVADDAPDQSVRLVKEMLAILEAMSRSKGREGGGRKR